MNANYIPASDNDFQNWSANLMTELSGKIADWSIPAVDFTALGALATDWCAAWQARLLPDSGKISTRNKNTARKAFETAIRGFVKSFLLYNPALTDGDKDRVGLPIHDTTRSKSTAPTTRPIADVAFKSAQLIFTFKDEGAEKRGKPKGVSAVEMTWDFCTDVTTVINVGQLGKSETATATSLKLTCSQGDRGKQIVFFLRWIGATGELKGEWNGPFTAIFP